MKNVKIRIGNLEFSKATYLGPVPKFPAFDICMIVRNDNYFEFKKGYFKLKPNSKDSYVYAGPDESRHCEFISYDKSCFDSPESKFAIATYEYDEKNNQYCMIIYDGNFNDILKPEHKTERNDFWKIIEAIKASGIFDEENIAPDEKNKA